MKFLISLLTFYTTITAVVADTREFKIGAVLALTGAGQIWGQSALQGANLAIEQYVAAHPNGKIKPRLVVEDSRTEPKSAVTAWKKLVEVDTVDVVLGDVWEFLTNPLIPLADKAKVLLVSPTVVDASIQFRSPYFRSAGARIGLLRAAIDRFFDLNQGIKSIAIIHWENDWGNAYNSLWKESAQSHGVTISSEQSVSSFENDYRIEVTKLLQHKPDALLLSIHTERILRRLQEQRVALPILTASNVTEVLADGTLSMALAEGIYFTDWKPSESFRATYRAKYLKDPICEAGNSFDVITALITAAERNYDNLKDGLVGIKFKGVSTDLDFSEPLSVNLSVGSLRQVMGGKVYDR